ncbi:hypothetical protein FBEOM_5408 [Fusarium beomiforme]|uniref:DUF7924 domain-containing protein n=1 Tax=Fusarium beomiforme TaxID=44412 RepID=A0A9P5DX65_9HYPO|nr:hypothetical protein FBEOM_5408 [Fusarium beomiforme]
MGSRVITPSVNTGSSGLSGRSLEENPHYRELNLAANHIYFWDRYEPVPQEIAGLVQLIKRDRDSPGPSPVDIQHDADLYHLLLGTAKSEVVEYFKNKIFPKPRCSDNLIRNDRITMAKHTLPDTGSGPKLSITVPEMLYGYRGTAFGGQHPQLISMGTEMIADNHLNSLLYPFLVIEFKDDGESMLVAANQCMGGSVSYINIAESLNHGLRQCKSDSVHPIDVAAFSIAMNGSEARINIAWKENELGIYMVNFNVFHLHDPQQYIKFRKYVRNIIDWCKGARPGSDSQVHRHPHRGELEGSFSDSQVPQATAVGRSCG